MGDNNTINNWESGSNTKAFDNLDVLRKIYSGKIADGTCDFDSGITRLDDGFDPKYALYWDPNSGETYEVHEGSNCFITIRTVQDEFGYEVQKYYFDGQNAPSVQYIKTKSYS